MLTGILMESPSGIQMPWGKVAGGTVRQCPAPAEAPPRAEPPQTLCTVPKTPEPNTLSRFSSVSLKMRARTLLAFSLGSSGSRLCRDGSSGDRDGDREWWGQGQE